MHQNQLSIVLKNNHHMHNILAVVLPGIANITVLNFLNFLKNLNFLNLQGRQAPSKRHLSAHFAIGLGDFKNSTNGK
jgi:hypothetical protein